jgi:hypothetical protein
VLVHDHSIFPLVHCKESPYCFYLRIANAQLLLNYNRLRRSRHCSTTADLVDSVLFYGTYGCGIGCTHFSMHVNQLSSQFYFELPSSCVHLVGEKIPTRTLTRGNPSRDPYGLPNP